MSTKQPPAATLLIASGCIHCPAVLAALAEMLKKGEISRLEASNIAVAPEAASAVGARSVPWTRIGDFILHGVQTPSELSRWAALAAAGAGRGDYLTELLQHQRLDEAIAYAGDLPDAAHVLAGMISDLETPMAVRIGVGALFEELLPNGRLHDAVTALAPLTHHTDSQVRADAAHYLGLSGDPKAVASLQPLTQDGNADVREIAKESLLELDTE